MSKLSDLIITVNEMLDLRVYCVADISAITGAPLSMVETIVANRFDIACERSERESAAERAGQMMLDLQA